MKTIRKIIACLLAVLTALTAAASVAAYADDTSGYIPDDTPRLIDDAYDGGSFSGYIPDDEERLTSETGWDYFDYNRHPITIARFNALIQAAEDDIAARETIVGDKFYPPAIHALNDALDAARKLANDENARFNDIELAYRRLYQALIAPKNADAYINETLLRAIYHYTADLTQNYGDCFDETNLKKLHDVEFDAQMEILYTADTQTKVNEACTRLLAALADIDVLRETGEFMAPKLFSGIYSVVFEALGDDELAIIEAPFPSDYNGYYLINARNGVEQPLEQCVRIGKYIYEDYNYFYPSDLGYLLVDPEEHAYMTLEQGLTRGVISGDDLYPLYLDGRLTFRMRKAADVNCDGATNILDATAVQLKAAHMKTAIRQADIYFDFNNDGVVDIKDATALQLEIAGIANHDLN